MILGKPPISMGFAESSGIGPTSVVGWSALVSFVKRALSNRRMAHSLAKVKRSLTGCDGLKRLNDQSFRVRMGGANHVAVKANPDMMRVLFGVLVFGVLRSCDAGFARF
jgi:hypothetical protein